MDAVEPFDFKDIKDFNPAFMAGFVAEQADEKAMKQKIEQKKKLAIH